MRPVELALVGVLLAIVGLSGRSCPSLPFLARRSVSHLLRLAMILLALSVWLSSACAPGPVASPAATACPTMTRAVPTPVATPTISTPAPSPTLESRPLVARVSEEALFETLADLVSLRPYRGWRSSGSPGEGEALDYVARRLGELSRLRDWGMTVTREVVPVYLSNHVHQVQLTLGLDGGEQTVPAQVPWGHIDDAARAVQFDTDERTGDTNPNPVTVQGKPLVIMTTSALESPAGVAGKVVFVDYALLDPVVHGSTARERAAALRNARPAAIVMVTTYSEQDGRSTGTYALDRPALTQVNAAHVPVVTVRLEDLAPLGIKSLDDLAQAESVSLTVDVDILSPAVSGNLIVRIPGTDESRHLILGAHIDTANTPGTLDNGSGTAVLLEVARVLDQGGERPPVTLYLIWFGSEELGLYGSLTWANAHPDLARDALAVVTFDSLTHPMDGLTPTLNLSYWSDGLAPQRSAVPGVLAEAAREAGVEVRAMPSRSIISDYAALAAFGAPCLNVAFEAATGDESAQAVQYTGHLHCPYDDMDLARLGASRRGLVSMARLAAVAVSELPRRETGGFREFPAPVRRALFVGSHTEAAHMMIAGSPELGRLLAAAGYVVDTIPWGTPVTAARLRDAILVVVMPTMDYGDASGSVDWSPDEVRALEEYVRGGGLLVLTNSALRLKYRNWRYEANEDSSAMNALSERFGVRFGSGALEATSATVVSDHALVKGLDSLPLTGGNAVPFTLSEASAQVLAEAGGSPVVALIDVGQGQVLVLGDVGLLGSRLDQACHPFWRRLARLQSGS